MLIILVSADPGRCRRKTIMYRSPHRNLACLSAAMMVATTLLTVTVAPEPAAASTTRMTAQAARFPLA